MLFGRKLPDVGDRDHRDAAVQHLIDRALVQFGIRRERALDVIDIGEQGLFVVGRAAGDDPDRAAAEARIDQLHRARGIIGHHRNAHGVVPQFQRQRDIGFGFGRAQPEMEGRRFQHLTARIQRRDAAFALHVRGQRAPA